MRVLFYKSDGPWVPLPLSPGMRVGLVAGAAPPGRDAFDASASAGGAGLRVAPGESGDVAVHLFVKDGAPVRVGGRRVAGGLKRLAGRREMIVVGGRPFYLAVDEVARVEVFAGEAPIRCARCRGEILPGVSMVVCCPNCRAVMHEETDGRRCFSYGQCLCGVESSLDASAAWTPELL